MVPAVLVMPISLPAWRGHVHVIDTVAANTGCGKYFAQAQNTDGSISRLHIADAEQADAQPAKGNGLHQLAHEGDIHATENHAICNVTGNIETEKRGDVRQHGHQTHRGEGDPQAFVYVLRQPGQDDVEGPVVAEMRNYDGPQGFIL